MKILKKRKSTLIRSLGIIRGRQSGNHLFRDRPEQISVNFTFDVSDLHWSHFYLSTGMLNYKCEHKTVTEGK